jgi:hypothetical protein
MTIEVVDVAAVVGVAMVVDVSTGGSVVVVSAVSAAPHPAASSAPATSTSILRLIEVPFSCVSAGRRRTRQRHCISEGSQKEGAAVTNAGDLVDTGATA